jgi:LacI family gluconate utilization system Gnt-I transcriptional repressor
MLATSMTTRKPPRAQPSRRHPTLTDVAQMVGVSTSTVSRALSMPGRVSKKTRERVEAAVAQIGFVPNLLAGGLASSQNHIIAFVVPSFSLLMFHRSVQQLVSRLSAEGYRALLLYGGRGADEMDKVMLQVVSLRPDAVVLIGADLSEVSRERLVRRRLPVLEMWDMPEDPIDMVIGFSHKQIGLSLGEFLVQRYARPLLVWGTRSRALSMQDALTYAFVQRELPAPRVHPAKFPPDFTDGREALRSALAAGDAPDVVVCLSDWAAHGALVEAQRQGLRVPQDIAIIGFGDQDFASQLEPSLTSVHIEQDRLATLAGDALLQRLRGVKPKQRVVNIGATLMERDSTGPRIGPARVNAAG